MLTKARNFLASNRDAAKLVERAEKFSVRLPLVGDVSVPPPDRLAFYAALGLLAAFEIIDWPVALAIGVGQAVIAHHVEEQPQTSSAEITTQAKSTAPVPKSAPRKSPPRKAAAAKAKPRKATGSAKSP